MKIYSLREMELRRAFVLGMVSLGCTGLTVLTWLVFANVYVTVLAGIALIFGNLFVSRILVGRRRT